MYSVVGCPRNSVKKYSVCLCTSVSPVFRAKLPEIPRNSLSQSGQNIAECQDFFLTEFISNAIQLKAPVVQKCSDAAQTLFC